MAEKIILFDVEGVGENWKFKLMPNGQIWFWVGNTHPECSNNIVFDNTSHRNKIHKVFRNLSICNDVGDIGGTQIAPEKMNADAVFSKALISLDS